MPGVGNVDIRERAKKDARGGGNLHQQRHGSNKVQDVLEKQQVVKFSREWKLLGVALEIKVKSLGKEEFHRGPRLEESVMAELTEQNSREEFRERKGRAKDKRRLRKELLNELEKKT